MRIDIYVKEERVFTEALSKVDDGWQQDGSEGEVMPHSANGLAALQRGIHGNLYGLHELESLGYTIEYLGIQALRGINYWALDLTSPWGKLERHYFDKASYLKVASQDESALHVDVDPTKVLKVSYSYDYQMHEGVMFSMVGKVIDLNKNVVIQNVVINSINVNSPQDVKQFLKP